MIPMILLYVIMKLTKLFCQLTVTFSEWHGLNLCIFYAFISKIYFTIKAKILKKKSIKYSAKNKCKFLRLAKAIFLVNVRNF